MYKGQASHSSLHALPRCFSAIQAGSGALEFDLYVCRYFFLLAGAHPLSELYRRLSVGQELSFKRTDKRQGAAKGAESLSRNHDAHKGMVGRHMSSEAGGSEVQNYPQLQIGF